MNADQMASAKVFLDTDVVAVPSAASPQTHYTAHPILMPICDDPETPQPAGTYYVGPTTIANQVHHGYRVARVIRSTETVLMFCGTQYVSSTAQSPGYAYWVGVNLDRNRLAQTAAATVTAPNGTTATDPVTYLVEGAPGVDMGQPVDGGLNQDQASDSPATDASFRSRNIRWRHKGNTTANVLFVDGHAAGLRYKSEFQNELLRRMVCVPTP
jgi:prepilin-type processing-associated H-X9-DG protein